MKEIKDAIMQLPRTELIELVTWLNEYHNDVWDKQIAEDADAGRPDAFFEEAMKE